MPITVETSEQRSSNLWMSRQPTRRELCKKYGVPLDFWAENTTFSLPNPCSFFNPPPHLKLADDPDLVNSSANGQNSFPVSLDDDTQLR